jgi:purine-binding chemotaxis protein CheW
MSSNSRNPDLINGGGSTLGGGEVLTLTVDGERFALAIGDLAEIIRPANITRVPLAPANLLGVANLRGTILPVIWLAGLLGRSAAPSLQRASRIVVVGREAPIGLLVDEVLAFDRTSDATRIDLAALLAQDFGALWRGTGTAKYTRRWNDRQGRARPQENPRDMRALVSFPLAGQEYALPLDSVVEVTVLAADVAGVPQTDHAMIGATTFNDGLLPLFSLRVLLGLSSQGFDRDRARVIVTRFGASLAGLLADGANDILRVSVDMIDPVPPVLTRGLGGGRIEAICRLDGGRRLVSILSLARLFDQATANQIPSEVEAGVPRMAGGPIQAETAEQFVVFVLGDEMYGLPIAAVDEVVRRPDTLTRVPGAPAFIEGLMNLRGKAVPLIDQRQRFASAGTNGRNRRVLIMTINGLLAGFVVDSISEILSVTPHELTAMPKLFVEGVQICDRIARKEHDGRAILLLDPAVLLDRTERDILAAIAGNAEAVSAS